MKNKTFLYTYDYEIDFIELFKLFWDEKIKIILITFVSIMISFAYIHSSPKLVNSSLTFESGNLFNLKVFQITNFDEIFFEENAVLKIFTKEFNDHEELVFVLSNDKKIKKEISKLSKSNQREKLYNYAQFFNLEYRGGKSFLNFIWRDTREAEEILEKTIELTIINTKKNIFESLEFYFESEKNKLVESDLSNIEYLLEQSAIARELNLTENYISSSVLFNFNVNNYGEYLRGYKAIDKQIDLIRNRKYSKYDTENVKKKINTLKLKENTNDLIHYNFINLISKADLNSGKVYILSIFLGLFIGLLFVLISNKHMIKKVFIDKKIN
tara:strand:+ start:6059 stop:7039 length:981 start_codon:yes stop_codon:yes gene_type:complete